MFKSVTAYKLYFFMLKQLVTWSPWSFPRTLVLTYLKFQSKLMTSMQQILRLLQLSLFEKRNLMALLRGDPPEEKLYDINQLALL